MLLLCGGVSGLKLRGFVLRGHASTLMAHAYAGSHVASHIP